MKIYLVNGFWPDFSEYTTAMWARAYASKTEAISAMNNIVSEVAEVLNGDVEADCHDSFIVERRETYGNYRTVASAKIDIVADAKAKGAASDLLAFSFMSGHNLKLMSRDGGIHCFDADEHIHFDADKVSYTCLALRVEEQEINVNDN